MCCCVVYEFVKKKSIKKTGRKGDESKWEISKGAFVRKI